MGGMVQKTMDSEVKAIERLKTVLEARPASTPQADTDEAAGA